MTLLDWFAGQALVGLNAGPNSDVMFKATAEAQRVSVPAVMADMSYHVAVAMIGEKRKRETDDES